MGTCSLAVVSGTQIRKSLLLKSAEGANKGGEVLVLQMEGGAQKLEPSNKGGHNKFHAYKSEKSFLSIKLSCIGNENVVRCLQKRREASRKFYISYVGGKGV